MTNTVGPKNPLSAFFMGVADMFNRAGDLQPMPVDERLDGKTALVTGANSGLGKAVAAALAERGAFVIMACRGGHPEAGEEVKKQSGSKLIEMMYVDLSDLESVQSLCDSLRESLIRIDIAILNAGLMPLNARRGPQGFELMFSVHFLANRLFVHPRTHTAAL